MIRFDAHAQSIRCLAYSPDQSYLASACEGGVLILWDLATRQIAFQVELNESIEAMTFLDHQQLILGTEKASIYRVDLAKQRVENSFDQLHTGSVRSIDYDRAMKRVLCTGWQSMLDVCGVDNPITRLATYNTPESIHHLSKAPTQPHYYCLGQSGKLYRIRDFIKDHPLDESFVFSESYSTCLVPHPHEALLAIGEQNGTIRIIHSETVQQVWSVQGHQRVVFQLAFTPDGQRLLSTSADGTVRCWDVESGREREAFRWHDRWVHCLAISPDGTTVATAGGDRVICIWDMPE